MSDSAKPSTSYVDHVARLEQRLSTDAALRHAVGGEFVATGELEHYLLRSRGLQNNHFVVDIGCGSGRLACQLAPFPGIRYVGIDVVPRLLAYAEELCARPDWKFAHATGTTIPCADGEADFVCFFSVFTHLPQEDIFRYFCEAHRVLKPGGLMVMSFLEFRVPTHWTIFMASIDGHRDDEHLNQFMDREAIEVLGAAAGFDVRTIHSGNTEYIPLPKEVRFEDGSRMNHAGSLGQSVAVLQKREFSSTGRAVVSPCEATPTATANEPKNDATVPRSAPNAPLLNVSSRTFIAAGGSVVMGFVVGGASDRRVLIRAIGPTLSVFGVPNPLPNCALEIFAGEDRRAENSSGWGGDVAFAATMATVGAFPLRAGSKDAALVVTLSPGSYTAMARGGSTKDEGIVLLEVYLID